MYRGRIVREGGPDLVSELEARGYAWITDSVDAVEAGPGGGLGGPTTW